MRAMKPNRRAILVAAAIYPGLLFVLGVAMWLATMWLCFGGKS